MAKVQVCVSIDESLLKWVEEGITDKTFATKSHAFEAGLAKLKLSYQNKAKRKKGADR